MTTITTVTIAQVSQVLQDCSLEHDYCKTCSVKAQCVTLWENTFAKQNYATTRILNRFKTIMRRSS